MAPKPAEADAYELLLRAIRTALNPQEQDRVLHAVLAGRLSSVPPEAAFSLPNRQQHGKPGADEVGFLVRLPPDLHGQFRGWCRSHGFSMAVVIRGVVERFLVQQGVRSLS